MGGDVISSCPFVAPSQNYNSIYVKVFENFSDGPNTMALSLGVRGPTF